jgi:tetratricopeptide (TPR) repeat protein
LQPFIPHQQFEDLIRRAVARALATDSLDDFLAGFRQDLAHEPAIGGQLDDAQGLRALGTLLGRAVWSATPAPRNGFLPKPLPMPGRNELCLCGSGLKFKRCCAAGPPVPALNPADIWPFVLEALPAAGRRAALESGRVPVESLEMSARRAAEDGKGKTAVGLLEPLFAEGFAGTDGRYGSAMTALCDAYDVLGWDRKKIELLERVRAEAPRSPLRSDACQRLATIALDRGDSPGAWAAFAEAQRDDPDSPAIGLLEVQLLIFEHRPDEARERAKFWRRRMQRIGDPGLDGAIEFLSAIIEDPAAAMAGIAIDSSAGAGERLSVELGGLEARPLPSYGLKAVDATAEPGDPSEYIAERLRGMGVSGSQIESMTGEFLTQLESFTAAADADASEFGDASEHAVDEGDGDEAHAGAEFHLVAPPAIAALEAEWHGISPVGKPISVSDEPTADEDPWDPDIEDGWMRFLERHPEAFDSIDILDDLAGVVELHPAGDVLHAMGSLQQPLVERVVRILRQALARQQEQELAPATEATSDNRKLAVRMPWPDVTNRPALRCLHRAHGLAMALGELDRARAHAELLLALNPGDNHGARTGLMNLLLRLDDDEAALDLAARFPDDRLAEIPYGRVLALVRLGREREARAAAREAVEMLPEVRRYLIRERAKQPKIEAYGFQVGGKDQAWLYRAEMRDVWLACPEALTLVRRAAGKG